MKKFIKQTLGNTLLALGSIVLTLLLLEAATRVATGRKYLDIDLRLRNAGLVYEPNQKQRWKRLEWDTFYGINSQGFRDFEYSDKGSKPKSLVILGDSFVEGFGVDLAKSFPKQLEQRLHDAGWSYRVYNAGLQGRQTPAYIQIYDRFFENKKEIPLVIMAFCVVMDIQRGPAPDSGQISYESRRPNQLVYGIKRFLCEYSVLYNFTRRLVKFNPKIRLLMTKLGFMGVVGFDLLPTDPRYKPYWEYTAGMILDFQKRLRSQGKEFVLLLIPMREQIENDRFKENLEKSGTDPRSIQLFAFNDFINAYCRRQGIRILDLTPILKSANNERPGGYHFETDNHWNVAGHTLVTNALFDFLMKNGLLEYVRSH
ncbi:MAG TPA: hypothetical protein DEB40_02725 [Elusimicrobia bacterium]|nr:hypothetical protein [Elusimicrobiota bacterium]